jgi:serine phosphatase RsbU (regulator of sigma subunit)
VVRTVKELVEVVPGSVKVALAALAGLCAMLGVGYLLTLLRSRRLDRHRRELVKEVGLLQSALLPPVPESLGGLHTSVAYRPADGPAAGGDFYDVFTIGEQRICVLVGDVSGHGRESVTQAALARYTLRTLLAAGHAPGEALARADELLMHDLRPNFVTVIAGVYEPGTRELTYAKAGHAPPIVLGAAHDPDAERPVPPIGLGVGDAWPEYRVQLREGVSVCLFTDGLEDARIGAVRVGRDEVARLLAAHVLPDAGRLLGDLEDLADRMSDDTAAVVLSRPRIA